jgi:hypothetical protein
MRRPSMGMAPRFLLPNLAAMLAAATLFYCLFLYGAGEKLFRDSDSGWHIRNGESILANRALPRTDPYSFSKAGQPWVSWEWGSDVLMGLAHRAGGLRALTALFSLTISAASWLWCRLSFAAGGDFLLTGLFAPLMITTSSAHWLARPHIFSWIFLLGVLLFMETVGRTPRSARVPPDPLFAQPDQPHAIPESPTVASAADQGVRLTINRLLLVAAASALWANLHATFFLFPVIALLYAASHLLRPFLWQLDPPAERAKSVQFLYVALAALAGSFLNPYGWQLHAHVFRYLWNDRLTSQIAEFQSFNFHDPDATQMAVTMGLAAAGGILALTQKKLAHFLLAAMFLWAGLRSARVLPLVALLILPLANAAFVEALRSARGLREPIRRGLDAALAYSARLRRIDLRLGGWAFSALALAASLLLLQTPAYSRHIGFPPATFPVAASDAVEQLPAGARILTSDSYGGYLIYRFAGARKVYFDGRSDFYGADFLKQYVVLMEARPGWLGIVSASGLTHALLPNASALTAALQQAGWTTLYRDGVATLLGRTNGAH